MLQTQAVIGPRPSYVVRARIARTNACWVSSSVSAWSPAVRVKR